jgi:hypothetical protein
MDCAHITHYFYPPWGPEFVMPWTLALFLHCFCPLSGTYFFSKQEGHDYLEA